MDLKADVLVFSEAAHEDFGLTPAAEDLRVRALTHSSGCIHRVRRGKLTEIVMKIPQSCEVLTHLYFYPAHTELYLCDDYVFLNRTRDRAMFQVRFPHSGYYAFKVYARQRHQDGGGGGGGSWPNVFNYVIEVLEAEDLVLPFPIAVECYDEEEGFELRQPAVRYLPSHTMLSFDLWVPGATSVLVINEGKRTGLVRDGGPSDTWTADVRTNSPGSELRVAAEFHLKTKLLTILLLYEVVDSERSKEEQEPRGTISTHASSPPKSDRSTKSDRLSAESEKSGTKLQQDDERPLMKFHLVNEETESKDQIQKIFAIEEDELLRKKAQKKEIDGVRTELLESIRSRKMVRLQRSISAIHKLRLSVELEKELRVARSTIEGLKRLEKLRDAILLLDANALSEVRRYTQPPPLVHDIMIAVLLILGHDEGQTRKWSTCQKLCNTLGRSGLKKKIEDFDLDSVHPEIVERAWQIVQHVNVSDVVQISQGAASFYSWVVGLYEEYSQQNRHQDTPEPANRKRQKQILLQLHNRSNEIIPPNHHRPTDLIRK